MQLQLAGFVRAAILAVASISLLSAEDWKTATALPGISFAELTPPQKNLVLKILREHDCSCNCGMKLAECRIADPACAYSNGLATEIIKAVQGGKSEKDAWAVATQSKWAHLEEPKLLDSPVKIPVSGSPVLGPTNAPITLVEFSDFQCPYCAAATPEIEALLKAYPTQVKLIFKQFPLEIHSQADLAASAAIAAQKQGKFWQLHDAMFAHPNQLARREILRMAKESGLDVDKLETDMDSTEVRETVVRDVQDGNRVGVDGTPVLFINGQRYNGPILLTALKKVLTEQFKQPALP